jgi:hypothetical protein
MQFKDKVAIVTGADRHRRHTRRRSPPPGRVVVAEINETQARGSP